MAEIETLTGPVSFGTLRLQSRVAMAPMTREQAPGGVPTEAMAGYYARRAQGGVGLIITEGIAPVQVGLFSDRVPRLYGEAPLAAWPPLVDAVHAGGAAIFAQVWHVGAFEPSLIGMPDSGVDVVRVSPSGLAGPSVPLGRAMTAADIDATIDAFASAAVAAKNIGFDGVEIHGAHGYLPDQFLWSPTNRRSDRYGGSLQDRARFAAEIVAECRRRCGPDFPLSFRFSQWKQLDYDARIASSPDELSALLAPIVDAGITFLHASTRRFWTPAFEGSERSLAAWTRRLTGLPVIAVGSVTLGNDFKSPQGKLAAPADADQLSRIEKALAAGDFDLLAIGRALLANPDWVRLVAGGHADRLQPFTKALLESLD